MKLTEIKFTKRVNTAKFEHEEMTLTAQPGPKETVQEVVALMREQMEEVMSPSISLEGEEEGGEKSLAQSSLDKKQARAKKKSLDYDEDEDEDETATDEEGGDDDGEEKRRRRRR